MDCTDVLQDLFTTSLWQEIYRAPDDRLMAVAYRRATEMADSNFFDHVDPYGVWPNKRVRGAGFPLPEHYRDDSNQVESIAAGHLTPADALTALVASEDHHDHVTGKGFWIRHVLFGVACAENASSRYQRYYVIVTAPRRFDIFLPSVMKQARELGGTVVYEEGFPQVMYLPRVERLIVNP